MRAPELTADRAAGPRREVGDGDLPDAAYTSELVGGPGAFTDFELVAANDRG